MSESLPAGISDATLRLALTNGIGPRMRLLLLEEFGSAEQVLAASGDALRQVRGMGPKLTRRLFEARELDVDALRRECEQHQVRILSSREAGYPAGLNEIADPPGVLFVRGELAEADQLAVAIVGTRHATRYGLTQADRLARGLARAGVTVVSGLARGVDGAAHRGALAEQGRTLAVLGSGVLSVYPPEHRGLADSIVAQRQGAVCSELGPRRPPQSGTFPQRNRLISGLSLGVVVVEAGERSGALITARHAAEQNREVFAVPGCVDSRMSRGCHALLRDGARLVETTDDILDELGPLSRSVPTAGQGTVRHPAELQLNDQERAVLQAIECTPTDVDHVIRASGLSVQRTLATLSVLEMRHLVQRISGTVVVRR